MTEFEKSSEENGKYAPGVNRNARLVVRNLPWAATEDSIRKHFESYGDVEEVKLLRRPDGKLVGCGFVHFKMVPMANKALVATNKKSFMGRPLHVGWAIPKNKYEDKIKAEGDDKSGKNRKRKHSESNEVNIPHIKEENTDTKPQEKKDKVRLNRNARLIVRNVSFKATEESLREHFAPYGDIHEVKLLKKPDGKLVGCAFIFYKNIPMAKKALLNTNMKPFLGRPISVDWAIAKDKYMQHMDAQRLDMQDKVKKEESDDEDQDTKEDVKADFNADVKSESEDSEDETKPDVSDDEGDEDEDEEMSDDGSQVSQAPEKKRIQLNDAEDGRTVFIKNVSFSIDDDKLRAFAEKTAPVEYALVCVDKFTEHSKGSAFVKFMSEEDASRFLSLPASELVLEGQTVEPCPALTRDHVGKEKKQSKDNRNLYLVKEGVIVAGTRAAVGVSASDMAKRLALERNKTQMLKNLNRFVSKYRLVVSNLPPHYDDARLRKLTTQTVGRQATVTECRVMRDLRAPLQPDGKHPSKGFGFVMFTRTEDALTCLRKLNNNPDVFDSNNRPIVSFSIEDRTALNARKKRLEKSIANNPTNKNKDSAEGYKKRKNKEKPEEGAVKRQKFEKSKAPQNNKYKNSKSDTSTLGKFVKRPNLNEDTEEFAGLTSKQGTKHLMRSGHKLKSQADLHRQNVKLEKKQSKKKLKLKMAMKERVKQPKMRINKNPKGDKTNRTQKANVVKVAKQSFEDIKNKYKSKLVSGNSLERVKSKWYE